MADKEWNLLDENKNKSGTNSRSGGIIVRGINEESSMSKAEKDSEVLLGMDLRKGQPVFHAGDPIVFRSENGDSFSISKEQLSMHLLMLGGIGTGKTNVFYQIIEPVYQNMDQQDVMIIFDTKGDYEKKFSRMTRGLLIGNGPEYLGNSAIWNIYGEVMGELPDPGRYIYKKEWEINAREILKTIFKSRRSEQQPFFAEAAADLISLKIIQVLRKGDFSQMHTYKLKEFFRNATVADYDELVSSERDFAYAKQYYGDGKTPQALGVFAYINSMIADCLIGIFGDQTFGQEFAMRELVKKKGRRVVFVEYDLRTGEVLSPIYQLLYDQALKEALGRSEGEKGNVYLFCDEMKLLGELNHIDDGLNFGRSMGVKIVSGLQSVEQLFDIYGDHRGRAIMSGFSNIFCFRTPDYNTRCYISEFFGTNYQHIPFYKDGYQRDYYQREGHVVEEWSIQRLKRG